MHACPDKLFLLKLQPPLCHWLSGCLACTAWAEGLPTGQHCKHQKAERLEERGAGVHVCTWGVDIAGKIGHLHQIALRLQRLQLRGWGSAHSRSASRARHADGPRRGTLCMRAGRGGRPELRRRRSRAQAGSCSGMPWTACGTTGPAEPAPGGSLRTGPGRAELITLSLLYYEQASRGIQQGRLPRFLACWRMIMYCRTVSG